MKTLGSVRNGWDAQSATVYKQKHHDMTPKPAQEES